jgi:hypothetical protein
MATVINLHSIFRYLTDNEEFLLSVIEVDEKIPGSKKKKSQNVMSNMIADYNVLLPYERQEYKMLPKQIKIFLNPKYSRLGIKNVYEKQFNICNISFLNSLNMILRPELFKTSSEEQIKNVSLLENFIIHKISRNYHIDKVKNTKKAQAHNKSIVELLTLGKVSSEVIQYVVDIFEINLIVFDLTKSETVFYWVKGNKYPYLNLFKDIYFMTCIQGNYEPISILDDNISIEDVHKIYIHILVNLDNIIINQECKLSVTTLLYLETWNISLSDYYFIIRKFYNTSVSKTINKSIKDFKALTCDDE